MTTKTIGLGILFLVLSSTALIAQGGSDEVSQRNNGRAEMQERGNRREQGSQRQNSNRGQGTMGEITSIDVIENTFAIEGKNNLSGTFSIDSDTVIVSKDDYQNLIEAHNGSQGRDVRDSIDTEGMSDAEIRQAMFDAREEIMAAVEQELKSISLSTSRLKEGDNVIVHLSRDNDDNTARIIVIQ